MCVIFKYIRRVYVCARTPLNAIICVCIQINTHRNYLHTTENFSNKKTEKIKTIDFQIKLQ